MLGQTVVLFALYFAGSQANGPVNDGGKAYRVTLNDGNAIPAMGLGTFLGFDKDGQAKPKGDEVTKAVEAGIDSGYRMIDTSPLYKIEPQIGAAINNKIKDGTIKREDLFVVTKLPNTKHAQADVVPALRASLKDLDIEYVDLYLIHFPMGFTDDYKNDGIDYLETWKGMEETKRLGLAKSIGVSNFNISQLQRLLDNAEITPTINQVEVNLHLSQGPLVEYCRSKNIVVMAYAPFGTIFSTEGPPPKVDDSKINEIASKHKKTVPQIAIRYLIQRGLVPIPKSTNNDRIQQNINVFDFQLDKDDLKVLDSFNANYRTVKPSFWQDHPYYPFEKTDNPTKNPFLTMSITI